MDELTPLRNTRDDTSAPRPEAVARARSALLDAAAQARASHDHAKNADAGRVPLRHRASAALTTWLVFAFAGPGGTRERAGRPSWSRMSAVATGLLISAVFVTGAAAVWVPQFGVGPAGEAVDVDLTLAVEYTTLSGELIRCTYAVSLSAASGYADVEAARSLLLSQDWRTFGEDVKQAALENPFTDTGPEWKNLDDALREKIAFEQAAAQLVRERAGGLLPADAAVGSTTDCSGRVS